MEGIGMLSNSFNRYFFFKPDKRVVYLKVLILKAAVTPYFLMLFARFELFCLDFVY